MPKLRNGHLSTHDMIRLLTKHPDWTASAPITIHKRALRAFNTNGNVVRQVLRGNTWHPILSTTDRLDWTVHRPAGEKKRERVKLGEVSTVGHPWGSTAVQVACDNLDPGEWTIYAERKR